MAWIKRIKPGSEAAITHHIRHYLRMKGIFHFKHWSGLGSQKGVPDIIGVLPGGRALFIEVKTKSGTVRKEQAEFIAGLERAGALVFVARSIDDVMAKIK